MQAWLLPFLCLAGPWLAAADPVAISPQPAPSGVAVPTISAVLLSGRGKVLSGTVTCDAKGVAIAGSVFGLDEIAVCTLPVTVNQWLDQGALTIHGDQLRGVCREVTADQLAFSSDVLGTLAIPLLELSCVVLAPTRWTELPALAAGKPGAVLTNGDRVEGTLAFINLEAVGIDNGRRIVQVPRARAKAVVVRTPNQANPARPRCLVRLGSGDRLAASGAKPTATGIQLDGVLGRNATLALPFASIASWSIESSRSLPLTSVPALALSAKPKTGGALPVPIDVGADGGWLYGGGLPAERGLVLPAGGIGEWTLAGQSTLLAWAACAPANADGHLQILVDGRVAFDSGQLLPDQPPRLVEVPLNGARALSLVSVLDGDGGGAVAVCHPVLLR